MTESKKSFDPQRLYDVMNLWVLFRWRITTYINDLQLFSNYKFYTSTTLHIPVAQNHMSACCNNWLKTSQVGQGNKTLHCNLMRLTNHIHDRALVLLDINSDDEITYHLQIFSLKSLNVVQIWWNSFKALFEPLHYFQHNQAISLILPEFYSIILMLYSSNQTSWTVAVIF